ncbi:MAG: nuclear transport factor 2 family protein [Alphaproteobacteria bacterium]
MKNTREAIIKTYFDMWVSRDFSGLDKIFASDIYYSECYGPEYKGLSEISLWIKDMTAKQIVLKWDIKSFIHADDTVIVEWYFKEQQKEFVNDFNGVSIIEFSEDKISSIKEFESKAQHITPFRK